MSGCAGWGRGLQGLSPVPREGPWKGWLPVVTASARCSKSPGSSWRPVHRWSTGGLQQAPSPPDSPGPHPLLRSAASSSPGQGTRPRLFASTGSGEQPVSTKRCFYCSFPPTHWLPCQSLASPSPPTTTENLPPPQPPSPPAPPLVSQFLLFFCLAQVIVRREKPWSIQFQMLRSSSQRGTKRRGECHIESLQLHLPAAPAPSGSAGGHRVLADSPVAGELLCFQFTVRLNLQRLTRLIYFVADGVRKARSEIWVRFFAVTHNTAESAGSRRQLGASLRAWTCGLACVSSGFRSPARAERPRRRFSPRPADLCSRQWVREALAEFEHELGAKLRPYLTLAWLWPFSSLPSTTLAHLGPGCPLLINSPPSHKNTLTVVSGFGKSITLPSARPGGASGSRPSSGHSLWILGPLWQHF